MSDWNRTVTNPIVWLASLIVISTILLIGASVFGIDKGVLTGMAKPDFARGLITYLFAIVTIGVALALILWVLAGPDPTDANDARFQRGKEILGLLMGVFGTIVGFYFGAESSKPPSPNLEISTLDVDPKLPQSGSTITLRAVVRGGTPPYKVGVAQGNDNLELNDLAGDGGWVSKQVKLRDVKPGESPTIRMSVQDATGKRSDQAAPINVALPP